MEALRFVLLVIIIDCGSAFVFGLILLPVGFGRNGKNERGGEGRGGEEEIKFFEGVVFVASAIQMHEIRSNLIVFTNLWLEKPSVKLENG